MRPAPVAMELTDHQLRLLRICDAVRWGETERLNAYNYHLIRRAVGQRDPVVTFEFKLACDHAIAHGMQPPPSPPVGPKRSPWLETYDVPFWRLEAVELDEVKAEDVWAAVERQLEEHQEQLDLAEHLRSVASDDDAPSDVHAD